MVNARVEVVFASKIVPVVVTVVKVSLENAQVIQMILSVVIIFLAQLMMEEKENVYLVVNAVVIKLVENAQEVMISNVASETQLHHQIIHIMDHAMEGVVLVLILIILLAALKLLLANAKVEIMFYAVLQEESLHGILTKVNTKKLFAQSMEKINL
jgi:hypothetical protein